MPLPLTPLDEDALPVTVRKAVLPAVALQLRLVAARGLAALSPQELVAALYQLSHDEDQGIRDTADKTARELPDAVLLGALSAPLDARVLDWFARRIVQRPEPIALVLANLRTADETFATLAALGGVALADLIAQNEQRLLRHPAIITALYLNPRTRVSTAIRAVELAVRNGVDVEGIPSFEEVKAAIEHDGSPSPETDPAFAAALALGGDVARIDGPLDEHTAEAQAAAADRLAEELAQEQAPADTPQDVSRLPLAAKLRLAAIGNAFARAQLVRDSNKVIALAAVRSPALTEQEAERYSGNRSLHEEVIRYLATQRAFTKRYSVKLNLVNNPKCPLAIGIGFLGHLTAKDLKHLSRSKSVPSALTRAAQNLVAKREQR
jgi:hypothetical protein